MTDWIDFEGRVITMEWGESVYTVLPIPPDVLDVLHLQSAKRVEVELNDHPVNLALTKSPVLEQTFVYTGKTVLRETGIGVGEAIDVRMRKADPDAVDVPEDVVLAMRQNDLSNKWNALTPGKKRGLLHQVNSAKRAQTRAARIVKLVAQVKSI